MNASWFKFGGVSGLIGLAIGLLHVLGKTHVRITPPFGESALVYGIQSGIFTQMGLIGISGVDIPNYVSRVIAIANIAIAIGFILSGIVYYIGAALVEFFDVKVRSFWKAATAGVLGSLITCLAFILLIYWANVSMHPTPPCSGTECIWNLQAAAAANAVAEIASLPYTLVGEVGFAAVTWQLYRVMGWRLPE